jgi:hypothetical protein
VSATKALSFLGNTATSGVFAFLGFRHLMLLGD